MTANEESILIEAAAKGNKECQEKIIKENTGLVKSIAKRFTACIKVNKNSVILGKRK